MCELYGIAVQVPNGLCKLHKVFLAPHLSRANQDLGSHCKMAAGPKYCGMHGLLPELTGQDFIRSTKDMAL